LELVVNGNFTLGERRMKACVPVNTFEVVQKSKPADQTADSSGAFLTEHAFVDWPSYQIPNRSGPRVKAPAFAGSSLKTCIDRCSTTDKTHQGEHRFLSLHSSDTLGALSGTLRFDRTHNVAVLSAFSAGWTVMDVDGDGRYGSLTLLFCVLRFNRWYVFVVF